jgi:ABC-2 type transport system permease protein
VLVAIALVFGVVVFVVSVASMLIGILLGQQARASTHVQASLSTPGALRAIVGGAIYLTLIGHCRGSHAETARRLSSAAAGCGC